MNGAPRLAVHDTGDGPAVLFLHAFPLDATQWDHQVAALSGAHRCLRPDVWGCGDSPPPPGTATTLDDVARSILERLDAVDVDRFAIIGLSMGGYLGFALLRAAASRITALALCNTRAGADTDAARADRVAVAKRVLTDDDVTFLVEPDVDRLLGAAARREPHIADPVRGRIRRCTPAGVAFAQRAMAAREDSVALLDSIAVPTLVVSGGEDSVIPAADAQLMVDRIRGARHVTLACGHLSNLERPHEFTRAIGEFLQSAAA